MTCSIDEKRLEKTIAFHGHRCPGLAIGIRAAELALQRLGDIAGKDRVAVVETDMCGVDAIQFLTGCTLGQGNLIQKDYGKMAFSFYDRTTGNGFRALLRPKIQGEDGLKLGALMKKVFGNTASPEEQRAYEHLNLAMQQRYLQATLEEMFDIKETKLPAPRPAVILQSLCCAACGEMTMESRTRRFDGNTLCIPCFERTEQKI